MEKCPCGSQIQYSACCKLIHDNHDNAHSAEALMRARFSAFNKKLVIFLYNTTHPTTRRFVKKTEIQNWVENNKWMHLKILNSTKTTVEFKAYYLNQHLESEVQHEKSQFKDFQGRWYYLKGVFIS